MDFGAKIKAARKAKGLTQEELGELLGVQKSAVAKYENGRVVNIKRSVLKKIADVLEIRPTELIFEEGQEPEEMADITAQVLLNPGTLAMVEQYLKLSEADQFAIRLMVASLAEKEKKDRPGGQSDR